MLNKKSFKKVLTNQKINGIIQVEREVRVMAKIKIEPMKRKDVKLSVRDEWIPESWRYNGAGAHKNKKKEIPRKAKYKKSWD